MSATSIPGVVSFCRSAALTSLLGVLALSGCSKSAADYEKEAQTALDAGDGAKAEQLVGEGLKAVGDDKAVGWRLEKVRVEAMAKQAHGAALPPELDRLKAAYPAQASAQFYKTVADKLGTAGDKTGQIDVLVAGDKAFPEDPSFKEAIATLQNAGNVAPEDVERLKALGYL